MANYNSIDEMVLSEENFEKLIDNSGNDDNTLSFAGCDFFKYKGVVASTIYVSGNSFFGFGASSGHLQVANRDGKLWNFYREEGSLYNFYKFLRFRFDGYTRYNSTSASYKLTYDVFLFDSGHIYIHVINAPTNASYLGTSRLNAENGSLDFTLIAGEETEVYFKPLDELGKNFEMVDGRIDLSVPFDRKFLIEDEGSFYKEVDGNLEEILNIGELSAQVFKTHGFDSFTNPNLLISLNKPSIYYFQDSDINIPLMSLKLIAKPYNQIVETEIIDMTDSSILGIEKVEIDSDDEILFAFSFDGGLTYLNFINGKWGVLTEEDSGMTRTAVAEIGTDDWALVAGDTCKIRFLLKDLSWLKEIVVHYVNGGV